MRATRDLPDPTHATEESEERASVRRSWQASVTALLFASCYASVHRLWVPLGLHFTTLSESPFARVDPAFLPGLFLWARVRRAEKLSNVEAALAGAIVAFGVSEVASIVLGHYEGWLALSHGISSVPMSLAAFAMLLHREKRPSLASAWVGALALVAIVSPQVIHDPVASSAPQAQTKASDSKPRELIPVVETAAATALCGSQELAVRIGSDAALASELTLESCGLRPALVKLDHGRLRLRNSSGQAANLHFVVFHGNTQRMGWNLVLRGGVTMESPVLSLRAGEIGLLYSDSSPAAGLAIVVAPEPREFQVRASRLPLTLRKEIP